MAMSDQKEIQRVLQLIHPLDISRYLLHRGWIKKSAIRNDISLFISPATKDSPAPSIELVIPKSQDFRDYPESIWRTLKTLSAYENKNITDIIIQIRSLCDIFKARVISLETSDGSIAIHKCIEIVSQINELIIYSA